MVDSYLAGYLADRFGRKPILFISLFAQGIVGTIQACSSSFTMFIIVRFFIGILDQGYELPVYSMVSELFTPRWRPYSFICMMNFWAGGILSLPIIAYFIRDWRYLQLTISIPYLFLPIFYWFVSSFCYYGLSLNANRIAGDPYLNVFLFGAIEIPSHFLATGIVVWFGRRWPICIFLLVTGMASVGVSFIPEQTATGEDLTVAIVTTALIGKFSIALVFAIVCLYASEIFPTVLRNKGMGLVGIASRVGALLAPFVLLMENSLPQVPMILFGAVAIVPSLLVLVLPEMKGRHQPQTISDLEALFTEDKERRASIKSERERKLKLTSTTNKAFTAEEEPVV
ncbi:solute carrier family 22 member 13-like [Apostichopus japonicus]|uniref:solute carrier family 22 member 13-like n=1 Tax=Stichopus japonicus TaxID=307972 RepID=UPI003AB71803